MRSLLLTTAALAALSTAACTTEDDGTGGSGADAGAGGESGGPAGGSVTVDATDAETPAAFATTLAALVCQNLTTCCASTPSPLDADRCLFQFRTAFSSQSSRWANAWDPAVGLRCLEEAAAVAAGACLFSDGLDALTTATPACAAAFDLGRGDAAEGEACTTDDDCAPAEGAEVLCEGACVHDPLPVRARAGDACGWTCTEDDRGLECSGSGASESSGQCYTNDGLRCGEAETCEPLGTADARCGSSQDCAAGLHCGDAAACTAQVDVGAPCADLFDEPDAGACRSGRCDATSLTCAPPGAEGEPCERSAACETGLTCGDDDTCKPVEDPLVGFCADLAGR
ncbi:hypothetical protein L6V77_13610 [Myxococcota bacterium]|nr:hypothetical protein [Myxococcota bacterium]